MLDTIIHREMGDGLVDVIICFVWMSDSGYLPGFASGGRPVFSPRGARGIGFHLEPSYHINHKRGALGKCLVCVTLYRMTNWMMKHESSSCSQIAQASWKLEARPQILLLTPQFRS